MFWQSLKLKSLQAERRTLHRLTSLLVQQLVSQCNVVARLNAKKLQRVQNCVWHRIEGHPVFNLEPTEFFHDTCFCLCMCSLQYFSIDRTTLKFPNQKTYMCMLWINPSVPDCPYYKSWFFVSPFHYTLLSYYHLILGVDTSRCTTSSILAFPQQACHILLDNEIGSKTNLRFPIIGFVTQIVPVLSAIEIWEQSG